MGLETTKPSVGMGAWIPPEKFIFLNQTPHLQSKYVIFYTLGSSVKTGSGKFTTENNT